MGLFSKFKKDSGKNTKKLRSGVVKVANNERISSAGSRIHFEVPQELANQFVPIPGQYVNVHVILNGTRYTRSYSICSGPGENLAIAVKAINKGLVSNYLVNELKSGDEIELDFPLGNFRLDSKVPKIVCFAAGSGITPFMSFAKSLGTDQHMRLFYGNSKMDTTFFFEEIKNMSNVDTTFYFSQEANEGHKEGRLDKFHVSELIKAELPLLHADGFYICGPEEMIMGIQEVLNIFGVPKEKIHFELFTTPVLMKQEETTVVGNFKGTSQVSAILDGEVQRIELSTSGKTILEALDQAGMDVPYSCRGGVCCTCKAKIIEGSAQMTINYALTDKEVNEGYILTCQAHPTSEVLKLDFDV
ncbi:2Fe-2S iron-sulfur cluster-binding protein [Fluviicola sp.]|jgi:ring-1,2-phenylacetyl-CoA epoxidase subunit PaaE|uniref:2Fe-2S iron-sulfur cluster-binding protein n=1 Tax=Fluviicola sp. TaxID=1917219 RepID=UPI00282CA275|nr:2Fe-2S iron-sulfur cluster-binding protein [Fluviicola sp.]MDR0802442.1 2Fe-2S iron-sulfur cluster binding domain-containing protein [Fluviicola sp.]